MKHEPCSTCPWRKSSTAGGADIPGFSLEKMRGLRSTVGEGDGMRKIMACHGSKEGREIPCRGYIARHGWSNINVRIMALVGEISLRRIEEACAKLDLWSTFDEMLAAYEEAHAQVPDRGVDRQRR